MALNKSPYLSVRGERARGESWERTNPKLNCHGSHGNGRFKKSPVISRVKSRRHSEMRHGRTILPLVLGSGSRRVVGIKPSCNGLRNERESMNGIKDNSFDMMGRENQVRSCIRVEAEETSPCSQPRRGS